MNLPFFTTSGVRNGYQTAFDEMQNSLLVFIGKVKKTKQVVRKNGEEKYTVYETTFAISKVWLKNSKEKTTIETPPSCFISFKRNKEYLVYAGFTRKFLLQVGFCSRTKRLDQAEDYLREFSQKAVVLEKKVLKD